MYVLVFADEKTETALKFISRTKCQTLKVIIEFHNAYGY